MKPKKIIACLLSILLIFSLYACSISSSPSMDDKIEDAVRSNLRLEIILNYNATITNLTSNITNRGHNIYSVSGKITVKDKYNDFYTGNYDATVEYDPASDDFDVDYELGNLYKK